MRVNDQPLRMLRLRNCAVADVLCVCLYVCAGALQRAHVLLDFVRAAARGSIGCDTLEEPKSACAHCRRLQNNMQCKGQNSALCAAQRPPTIRCGKAPRQVQNDCMRQVTDQTTHHGRRWGGGGPRAIGCRHVLRSLSQPRASRASSNDYQQVGAQVSARVMACVLPTLLRLKRSLPPRNC